MGTTRTFGCEIECVPGIDPWSGSNAFYHEYVARGLTGWNRGMDGTVNGIYPAEFQSPILSGAAGIASITEMCALLNAHDTEVNRSCGLHVHVGGEGLTRRQVGTIDDTFAHFESAFFGMAGRGIGSRMRERSWCKPKRYVGDVADEKYQSMNTFRLWYANGGRHGRGEPTDPVIGGTIEVRAYGGTTNWKKIAGAVFLAVGFVELVAQDYLTPVSGDPIADPREAMESLIGLLGNHPSALLPDGVTDETIATVFDQCRTQARNAAAVLRLA